MKVIKVFYRDKNGKRQQAKKWYVDFSDHRGTRHRWPALGSEEQSREFARQLKRLIRYKSADEIPDMQLHRWIENLPKHFLKLLVSAGLLSQQRAAAGKLLKEHIADFSQSLIDKGDTRKQAQMTVSRVNRIVKDCKFTTWTDIAASQIQRCISKMQENSLSKKTANYYLKAFQHFARWMVEDRRATTSPVAHLRAVQVDKQDLRRQRRPLEPDEVRRLLEATRDAEPRFGLTGYQRAMIYRLAVESGLRANEIRQLRRADFDFDNCTVTVRDHTAKNRSEKTLPLRPDTSHEIETILSKKLPDAQAFKVPDKPANMLKPDLETAGIDYVDDTGRFADFHSLRHTTGSLLAASGVHPKIAQSIMRHGDINLTMSLYTHTLRGQESDAIGKLPDFSIPSREKQKNLKTGTDDSNDKNFAVYFAKQGHTTGDNSLQHTKTNRVLVSKNAVCSEAEGARTLNLRIDSPTL